MPNASIRNSSFILLALAAGCSNSSNEPTGTPSASAVRCAAIAASVEEAGFGSKVEVTCNDTYALIKSDTYPDHELMTGIVGTNEQVPVPAVDYSSPIRLAPSPAAAVTTIDAALGVAVNGVPMYDYSAGGELSQQELSTHHPEVDTVELGQLDNCGGHAGRGDDYHYHASPTCMIAQMANAGDDAIIGWAFDGYPIYGNNNPDGSTIDPGTLGLCNHQADESFGFRYHTSAGWPYTIQCLVGEIDPDMLPRVPPLRSANGMERPPGTPPQGGVEELVFAPEGDARVMRYRYGGEDYYISYEPSDTANCYLFEMRTVTNHGVVESGEYCR
ncbi:hypothetical protein ENSA5_60400 [Enhygromyxa salina]|uniref:YHYH domain-containing protein n=1 Tax=Enhygromyxa salina TaxID=215803 RepID=A0A2S9XDM6_9BACT|nr:YHYH protein [Enhygromyxa salina]PRP90965.1 hypothetical protein ENSA5_60400 [Enhygromyxa salina]